MWCFKAHSSTVCPTECPGMRLFYPSGKIGSKALGCQSWVLAAAFKAGGKKLFKMLGLSPTDPIF